MAYQACPDCGCRMYGGLCSNCQEELYILENQADCLGPVSEEFMQKAEEQRDRVRSAEVVQSIAQGDEDGEGRQQNILQDEVHVRSLV